MTYLTNDTAIVCWLHSLLSIGFDFFCNYCLNRVYMHKKWSSYRILTLNNETRLFIIIYSWFGDLRKFEVYAIHVWNGIQVHNHIIFKMTVSNFLFKCVNCQKPKQHKCAVFYKKKIKYFISFFYGNIRNDSL